MSKHIMWKRGFFGAAIAIWMVAIFLFSAQDGDTSHNLSSGFAEWTAGIIKPEYKSLSDHEKLALFDSIHFFIRKVAHFSEYALLGLLLHGFLSSFTRVKKCGVLIALGISVLYAALDEVHQFFIGGRDASLRDVAIDSAGALFGALVFAFVVWLGLKRRRSRREKALLQNREREIGGQI